MATTITFGRILTTPGARDAFAENNQNPLTFLSRHCAGDWGDLSLEDKKLNDRALMDGSRLLSAYHLNDGTKIYIITEADRSATTFLLPEEY